MENRQLSVSELAKANELLAEIRAHLDELCAGDRELRFAYNRKIAKELGYDERGKPIQRRKLKREKWREQSGKFAECGRDMELAYSVLDRTVAVDSYAFVESVFEQRFHSCILLLPLSYYPCSPASRRTKTKPVPPSANRRRFASATARSSRIGMMLSSLGRRPRMEGTNQGARSDSHRGF